MMGGHQLGAVTWKYVSYGAFAIALALVLFALVGTSKGLFFVYWGKYTDYLRRRLRALHIFRPVEPIAAAQLGFILLLLFGGIFANVAYWWLWASFIAVAPYFVIERKTRERVESLDSQAGPFALTLANGLKATPAIGAALDHVTGLMEGPISQEFQLALKEVRLGRSLDEALGAVALRCNSQKLAIVLVSLLIGRQLGGNLVKTLETTASTLRELERLEGVLRQRTAEGRMQIWAMAIAPFALCFGAYKLENQYFDPLLTNGWLGYACVIVAMVAYAGALVAARHIINVDL